MLSPSDIAAARQRVRARERRIGMGVTLYELTTCHACEDDGVSATAVHDERPLASLKTLYSDFVVRELSRHYNSAQPLHLEDVDTTTAAAVALTTSTTAATAAPTTTAHKRARADDDDADGSAAAAAVAAATTMAPQWLNEVRERMSAVLSADDVTTLLTALATTTRDKSTDDAACAIVLRGVYDKAQRTAIHAAVRTTLGGRYVSSTRGEDGAVCLQRANAAARRNDARRLRNSNNRRAPQHTVDDHSSANDDTTTAAAAVDASSPSSTLASYVHFTLYKENVDGVYALRQLARRAGMSVRQFTYSGTKDKRAVTLQRVSVSCSSSSSSSGNGGHEALLRRVNDARAVARGGRVRVCGFTCATHPLRLGDAMGNRFSIVLRLYNVTNDNSSSSSSNNNNNNDNNAACVTAPSAAFVSRVQHTLSTLGAINYYGPQRFGTTAILTSDVGVQLLCGRYAAALSLVFASKAQVAPPMRDAAACVARGDYRAALACTPHYCVHERDMLQHLLRTANGSNNNNSNKDDVSTAAAGVGYDVYGAFAVLPRTQAMLYFHAVQSLLWNSIAQRRLASAARLCVEVGDVVLARVYAQRTRQGSVNDDDDDSNNAVAFVADDTDDADDDVASAVTTTTTTTADAAVVGAAESCVLPDVHVLTADDDLTRFALTDVLLPVPGPDPQLQYPRSAGCTRDDYVRAMHALGVGDALLDARHELVRRYHFHGTYRALLVQPREVVVRATRVATWRTPVVRTDLERLQQQQQQQQEEHGEQQQQQQQQQDDNNDSDTAAPVHALVVEFTLPTGCYATSVVREVALVCSDDVHTGSDATGNTTCDADKDDDGSVRA